MRLDPATQRWTLMSAAADATSADNRWGLLPCLRRMDSTEFLASTVYIPKPMPYPLPSQPELSANQQAKMEKKFSKWLDSIHSAEQTG